MNAQAQAIGRISAAFQRALGAQARYVESLADQRVRNGSALGFVKLDGPGEAIANVSFPMLFLERPVFTFGLELGANSPLAAGDFPLMTATVASWTTREESLTTFYTGATLGIFTTGITGTAIVHYCFQARSFTTPTGSVGGVGDIL